MRSFFSRLYKRGERLGRSQLEDYLTEAFAALFERLGEPARRSLLHSLMDQGSVAGFDSSFPNLERAALLTQVNLGVSGYGKRPDMVLRLNDRDILVIESKLGASIAQHELPSTDGAEPVTSDQLRTYADWIHGRNKGPDAWPGAVILVTAWTPPPVGFPSKTKTKAIEIVRTWNQLAGSIAALSPSLEPFQRAFSKEFVSFLKEKNLLDRHFSSRDLAALTLYTASEDAFRHTIRTVMNAVARTYISLGTFKYASVGLDASIGGFLGWIYLPATFQSGSSRFWVGVGICPEAGEAFDEEFIAGEANEPFFLVYFGNEDKKQFPRPIERVSTVPEGWVEITKRPALVSIRPVRTFPGDPDMRTEAFTKWACDQIGLLAQVIEGNSTLLSAAGVTGKG